MNDRVRALAHVCTFVFGFRFVAGTQTHVASPDVLFTVDDTGLFLGRPDMLKAAFPGLASGAHAVTWKKWEPWSNLSDFNAFLSTACKDGRTISFDTLMADILQEKGLTVKKTGFAELITMEFRGTKTTKIRCYPVTIETQFDGVAALLLEPYATLIAALHGE